jgi:hypothetical protein
MRAKGAKARMKPLLVSSICTNCLTAQLKVRDLLQLFASGITQSPPGGGGNNQPAKYHAPGPDALEGKL